MLQYFVHTILRHSNQLEKQKQNNKPHNFVDLRLN